MACIVSLGSDLFASFCFTVSDHDLQQLKEKFRSICAEGGYCDGVNLEQFKRVMTGLGFERQPLERMFNLFDVNGDQSVRLTANPENLPAYLPTLPAVRSPVCQMCVRVCADVIVFFFAG
jgi:hypothetical protein